MKGLRVTCRESVMICPKYPSLNPKYYTLVFTLQPPSPYVLDPEMMASVSIKRGTMDRHRLCMWSSPKPDNVCLIEYK